MENKEAFLQEVQEGLSEIFKPYQKLLDQRQKLADFLNSLIRSVAQDNFIQLDELLKGKMAGMIENESGLEGCRGFFDRLRTYSDERVERYRLLFVEDLVACAKEAGLPLEVDFPRLKSFSGIEGAVDFGKRTTTINKKTLKSIDPRRIVSALLQEKRVLYDRPFDPQHFIGALYQTYKKMVDGQGLPLGRSIAVQDFYAEYTMSLQSKAFFQDMAKGKFRGYSADQFAVDIWRYFQAGTGGTSEGYFLQLRPGRNNSLWLIDSDGERRQITGISFQRVER